MAITQTIATLPAVLNDSATFYEDIAERNNSLVTVSFPSINTWATQANTLADEVNDKAAQVAAQAVDGGYSQNYINDNFYSQDYINSNFFSQNYINDNFVNQDINTLTNKTTPIDADEFVIADSTSSFDLKKLSFSNLKAWLKTLFIQKDYVIIVGSATFSPTNNAIVMTGIGNLGLKIGDVIKITGSTSNNKAFNVENLYGDGTGRVTDLNTIIVNYEHRGASTPTPSKRLVTETSNVSITLITNPKESEGLGWCTPSSTRNIGVVYTNSIGRALHISVTGTALNDDAFGVFIDDVYVGSSLFNINNYVTARTQVYAVVPDSSTYKVECDLVSSFNELR